MSDGPKDVKIIAPLRDRFRYFQSGAEGGTAGRRRGGQGSEWAGAAAAHGEDSRGGARGGRRRLQ